MNSTSLDLDINFPLFSKKNKSFSKKPQKSHTDIPIQNSQIPNEQHQQIEKQTPDCKNETSSTSTFADLGLSEWGIKTCSELGMKKPTEVQRYCIPKILAGNDVLGIAKTGTGKTATFALPILHRLAEDPYGVFALVVTPTRELAFQLAEQFRALGSSLHIRCAVIIGGMDMITQSKALMQRPHVVITTPGRIKVLLEDNPDVPPVFSRTKFLVLDEADRVLDVGFEEELRVIFKCLPKKRQTLLFSATMTDDLTALLELSSNKAFFFEAHEGLHTVESLRQQYITVPEHVKDVYLRYILSKMEDMSVRSVIIFFSEYRTCHRLALMLEELDFKVAELNSMIPQSLRQASVHRFKSGKVPILLATGVVERGLDIPMVDLVILYDVPRDPVEYVHRAGRTARAGREGLVLSIVSGNDVDLLHGIEATLGKQMEKFECKEKEVVADMTKVTKARRVANMKMLDDGFEDRVKARKKQKLADKNQKRNRAQVL
ncbi:DEAD-box ATP-dependent RNA helicase 36-like [Chenopodium quinoa]|uniref:RNA helicase 36 n=1 Tax=Chenopodium quinoa TaxID=63459 RepID=A0A803N230_CHEQI|nr:DEAD-box ATP-dependent RNA helicase 36-like [Chenopodium quinoa]